MSMQLQLILASASARRRKILATPGGQFSGGYSGSRTNIMGLPEDIVAAWLKREGLL